MKKLLSIVGIAAMAVGLHAADSFKTLVAARNYPAIIAQADTFLKEARENANQGFKDRVIHSIILARLSTGAYQNSSAAIADLEAIIKDIGYTRNSAPWARIFIHEKFKEYDKALSVPATDGSSKLRRAIVLAALKRYEEAADLAFSVGTSYAILAATRHIRQAKAPEKLYSYVLTGFSTGAIKEAADVKKLIVQILETDFSGTSINDAKIKVLLQTANRRYSRLLKPGVVSDWDETIQMIRQTLETY